MKPRQHLLICILVLSLSQIQAQDNDSLPPPVFKGFKAPRFAAKDNLLKASLFSFFWGQIPFTGEARITYERMVSDRHSLSFTGSYNYPQPFLFFSSLISKNGRFHQYSLRGGRAVLAYRYYPFRRFRAPEGIYFGPIVSYNSAKLKERNGNNDYLVLNYFNAGMVGGFQMQFDEHLYFDIFAGIGYKRNFSMTYDSRNNRRIFGDIGFLPAPYRNIKIYMQINACYAF